MEVVVGYARNKSENERWVIDSQPWKPFGM